MITRLQFDRVLTDYENELLTISQNKSYFYSVYEVFAADVKDIYNNTGFISQLQKLEYGVKRKHDDPNEFLSTIELHSIFSLLLHYRDWADGKQLIRAFEKIVGNDFIQLFDNLKLSPFPITLAHFERLYKFYNDEASDSYATDEEGEFEISINITPTSSGSYSPRYFTQEFSSSTEEEVEEKIAEKEKPRKLSSSV